MSSTLEDLFRKRNQQAQAQTQTQPVQNMSLTDMVRIRNEQAQVQAQPWSTRRVMANIAQISQTDPTKANKMFSDLMYLQTDPTSKYYNPYARVTNGAVSKLAEYGIDTSKIDDNFFKNNNYLLQYLRYDGNTNTPSTPGKKATDLERAAYQYYQLYIAEDATKKAEQQWADLQKELTYWATRTDRNLTDDEIISRIDWTKYGELDKADSDKSIKPHEYNRAIGFSRDAMYGVLWAARNGGGTGDIYSDMAYSALGEGKVWKENKELAAKLNFMDKENYSPYSVGMTNDKAGAFFGRQTFDQQWLDDNRMYGASNDPDVRKMYMEVAKAEQTTQKLEEQLALLNDSIDDMLKQDLSADEILENLKYDEDSYKDLFALDGTMALGPEGLTKTNRPIDYKWEDVEKRVREACEARGARKMVKGFVDTVGSIFGIDTSGVLSDAESTIDDKTKSDFDAINTTVRDVGTEAEKTALASGKSGLIEQGIGMLRNMVGNFSEGLKTSIYDTLKGDYMDFLRTRYEYEQVQKDTEAKKADYDRLDAEYNELQGRKETTEMIGGMSADEYQGLQALKNKDPGDETWAYYKHLLELGADKMGDTQMQEQYDAALRYVYQHVRPGDYVSDREVINPKAQEWWNALAKEMEADSTVSPIQTEIEAANNAGDDADALGVDLEIPSDGGYRDEDSDNEIRITLHKDESGQFVFESAVGNRTGTAYTQEEADKLLGYDPGATKLEWLTPEEEERLELITARREELRSQIEEGEDYLTKKRYVYNTACSDSNTLKATMLASAMVAQFTGSDVDPTLISGIDYMYQVSQTKRPPEYSSMAYYDYAMQSGQMSEADAYAAASRDADLEADHADFLEKSLAKLDEIGIGFSDEERKNIQTEIDDLKRDAKLNNTVKLDTNEDFQTVVNDTKAKVSAGDIDVDIDFMIERAVNGDTRDDMTQARRIGAFMGIANAQRATRSKGDALYAKSMLTEKEWNRFYYLLGKDGKDAAQSYLDELMNPTYGIVATRMSKDKQQTVYEFAKQNGWAAAAATGASFLTNFISGGSQLAYIIGQNITGEDVNAYNSAFDYGNFTSAARAGSREVVQKTFGDFGTMLYDGFTSYVDSRMNAALVSGLFEDIASFIPDTKFAKWITGGDVANTKFGKFVAKASQDFVHAADMGLNAASSSYKEAIINGADKDQAMMTFLTTFFAETVSEAITVENIGEAMKRGSEEATRSISDFIKTMLKNGAGEFIGEGFNEWFERNHERYIMGALSEYEQTVQKYLDQDYPESLARKMADEETWKNVWRAGVTGFISSVFGTPTDYYRGYKAEQYNKLLEAYEEAEAKILDAVEEAATQEAVNKPDITESDVNGEPPAPPAAPAITEDAEQNEALFQQDTQAVAKMEAAENEQQNAYQQLSKDLTVLATAKKSADSTSVAVAMASVLNSGNTFVDTAAAQTIIKLAENDSTIAVQAVQTLLAIGYADGVNMTDIKTAIVQAALSQHEAHTALQEALYHESQGGITSKDVANLIGSLAGDLANIDIASEVKAAAKENHIANITNLIAATMGEQITTAKESLDSAKAQLTSAQENLEQRYNERDAAAQSVVEAVEAQNDTDASDEADNADAQHSSLHLDGMDEAVIAQAEKAVENAELAVEKAQKNLDKVNEQVMTEARKQAVTQVAQEEAEQAEAEAQTQEEAFKQATQQYPPVKAFTKPVTVPYVNGSGNATITGVFANFGNTTVYTTTDGLVTDAALGDWNLADTAELDKVLDKWKKKDNPLTPAWWLEHSIKAKDENDQNLEIIGIAGSLEGSEDVYGNKEAIVMDINGGLYNAQDLVWEKDPVTGEDGYDHVMTTYDTVNEDHPEKLKNITQEEVASTNDTDDVEEDEDYDLSKYFEDDDENFEADEGPLDIPESTPKESIQIDSSKFTTVHPEVGSNGDVEHVLTPYADYAGLYVSGTKVVGIAVKPTTKAVTFVDKMGDTYFVDDLHFGVGPGVDTQETLDFLKWASKQAEIKLKNAVEGTSTNADNLDYFQTLLDGIIQTLENAEQATEELGFTPPASLFDTISETNTDTDTVEDYTTDSDVTEDTAGAEQTTQTNVNPATGEVLEPWQNPKYHGEVVPINQNGTLYANGLKAPTSKNFKKWFWDRIAPEALPYLTTADGKPRIFFRGYGSYSNHLFPIHESHGHQNAHGENVYANFYMSTISTAKDYAGTSHITGLRYIKNWETAKAAMEDIGYELREEANPHNPSQMGYRLYQYGTPVGAGSVKSGKTWFAENELSKFRNTYGGNPVHKGILPGYIVMSKPLILDGKGGSYYHVEGNVTAPDGTHISDTMKTRLWANWAFDHGYDGLIVHDVKDNVGGGGEVGIEVVTPQSEQFKSVFNKGSWSKNKKNIVELKNGVEPDVNTTALEKAMGRPLSKAFRDIVYRRLANGEDVSIEEIKNLPEVQWVLKTRMEGSSMPYHLLKDNIGKGADWVQRIESQLPAAQVELQHRIKAKLDAMGSAIVDAKGKVTYNGDVRQDKRLDVIIGAPASGKSSISDYISQKYKSRFFDSDEAKALHPLYMNGLNSNYVHTESRFINEQRMAEAAVRGDNAILPVVGSSAISVARQIAGFKAAGYEVHLHMTDLNSNKSLSRALDRFAKKTRYIDAEYLMNETKVEDIENTFNTLKKEGEVVDGYVKWNTDVNFGDKPTVLEYSDEGETEIFDKGRTDGRSAGQTAKLPEGSPVDTGASQNGRPDGKRSNVKALKAKQNLTPTEKQAEKVAVKYSPVQIAKNLTRALGIGDYIGTRKFDWKQVSPNTRAYYEMRAKYIAVKNADVGNYAVTFHELGHAIADKFGIKATPDLMNRFKLLAPEFFDPSTGYTQDELWDEALGEFMWRYMESEDRAREFAGDAFYDNFERTIRGTPEGQAIEDARDQMRMWVAAPVGARMGATIRNRSDKAQAPLRQKIQGELRGVVAGLLDSTRVAQEFDRAVAEIGGKDLGVNSVRNMALWANTVGKQATSILMGAGMTDAYGRVVGDNLSDRFARVKFKGTKENLDLLNQLWLAKHSLDRDREGKPVFDEHITQAEREAFIAKTEAEHPEVAAALDELVGFWHEFMQNFMVDTGRLSQKAFDQMNEMYPYYAPTMRVKQGEAGRNFGKGKYKTYQVQHAKGSTEDIWNPFDTLCGMVNTIVAQNAMNRAGLAFDRLFQETPGLGNFAHQVTTYKAVTDEQDMSHKQKQVADLVGGMLDAETMDQLMDIIGPYGGFNQKNVASYDTLKVVRPDGTVVEYQFEDMELFKLLAGIQNKETNPALQAFGFFTRGMSALTTGSNPIFGIRNFQRDFQNSVNYGSWASNYGTGVLKWCAAAYEVWKGSNAYKDYVALGGGGWTRIDPSRRATRNELYSGLFEGYNTDGIGRTATWLGKKLWNGITLARLNEIIEQTSRFAEYRFGKHDLSTQEGKLEGYLAAQEATVDFNRSGNSAVALGCKKLIPFFNASAQGMYRTTRMLTEEERGRAPARFMKTIVNTALLSALSSVAIMKFSKPDDKKEFEMLSDDLKSKHFYLPNFAPSILGEAPFIRVPLAQDPLTYAVHNAVTNAMWSGQTEDGLMIDLAATAETIWDNLNPIGSGTILAPIFAINANKSWYGSRIVPSYLDRSKNPADQYTEETPQIFVDLGRAVGMSPLKLQYLAEQYTGFVGQLAIPALSPDGNGSIGGINAAINAARRRFVSDPLTSNDVTNGFYDTAELIENVINETNRGIPLNVLRRGLTLEEAGQAYEDAKALNSGIVSKTKEKINGLYDEIDAINKRKDLSDHDKYELASVRRRKIIELALDANEKMGEFREKYVTGTNVVTQILTAGSPSHKPTDEEKLPSIFKDDADSVYMQRAYEVYDETGKASALPHPERKVTLRDKYGNATDYEIEDAEWDAYLKVYKDAYEKYMVSKGARWSHYTTDRKREILSSAHGAGNTAMREKYAKDHGIRIKR